MKDQFGVPLEVGDKVVYTTGGQSNTSLVVGTILEIVIVTRRKATREEAIIKTSSNRRATNSRGSYELVALNPIMEKYPESFI